MYPGSAPTFKNIKKGRKEQNKRILLLKYLTNYDELQSGTICKIEIWIFNSYLLQLIQYILIVLAMITLESKQYNEMQCNRIQCRGDHLLLKTAPSSVSALSKKIDIISK